MRDITVAEILKLHGDWIQSTQFASIVAKRKDRSPRTAYSLIKEAVNNREILKVRLQNGTKLYGLDSFGPPSANRRETTGSARKHLVKHSQRIMKELAVFTAVRLLCMYDSGELEILSKEFCSHLKTGHEELFRLFERWRRLPEVAKVTFVGEGSEHKVRTHATEEEQRLAAEIRAGAALGLHYLRRMVEDGIPLKGECFTCRRWQHG